MFEVNLVPDVKAEMIAAQKKRNVVFFAAATVSAIAAGIVLLLLTIKVGQDAKIGGQDKQLSLMSTTLTKYDGLEDLLTVQKQLSDLQTLNQNKTMLSRVFTVLHSIVQTENGDEIDISSIDVNMETSELSFDGQANAGPDTDGIDYRVLESFTKGINLMKYDYGRYVDRYGAEIPTMCIFESDARGVPFTDDNGNVYAIWAKNVDGCDPSEGNNADVAQQGANGTTNLENTIAATTEATTSQQIQDVNISGGCDDPNLVCIYRTPLYSDWYKMGQITVEGEIKGIEHFASECITYSGVEENNTVHWSSTNRCDMAPDGIEISNSTNGRDTGGELVLMFSGILHMNPEVFSFNNKHMITITPSGRQNVTDSFIQVGDMFAEKAKAIDTR